jgi:hypothetical protein
MGSNHAQAARRVCRHTSCMSTRACHTRTGTLQQSASARQEASHVAGWRAHPQVKKGTDAKRCLDADHFDMLRPRHTRIACALDSVSTPLLQPADRPGLRPRCMLQVLLMNLWTSFCPQVVLGALTEHWSANTSTSALKKEVTGCIVAFRLVCGPGCPLPALACVDRWSALQWQQLYWSRGRLPPCVTISRWKDYIQRLTAFWLFLANLLGQRAPGCFRHVDENAACGMTTASHTQQPPSERMNVLTFNRLIAL